MKKIIFSSLLFCSAFFPCLTTNAVSANENTINRIFDYDEYLYKNYSTLENKIYEGAKFYNSTIGHKQIVKFGNISLNCYETEKITDNFLVGTIKELKFEHDFTYSTTNETTVSIQTSVGIKDMISTTLKFEDSSSVGTNTELTTAYDFGYSVSYGVNIQKNYSILGSYDINQIPSDKLTFRVSKVSCYLEVEIEESHEEKEWWWKWWTIEGSCKSNYTLRYYIDDLITFVYNDGTFGNNKVGLYKLQTIKKY